MTQYANRTRVIGLELTPGADRMYQLPAMSPGTFRLTVQPLSGGQVAGLTKKLYHGDTLVASSVDLNPMAPQQTLAEADNSWRLHVQLAHIPHQQSYYLTLEFPSMLPVLTRHIPLDFIQRGFDSNWNGRDYVSLQFAKTTLPGVDGGDPTTVTALQISFDPELASYHDLSAITYPIGNYPYVAFPNIQTKDAHLSIDTSSSGQVYILLQISFTGVDGAPIQLTLDDHSVMSSHDFSISVKFFLTTVHANDGDVPTVGDPPNPVDADSLSFPGFIGYRTEVTSDIEHQIYGDVPGAKAAFMDGIHTGVNVNGFNDYLKLAEQFLDKYAPQVGAIITPWLLGAAFDVTGVSYNNSVSTAPTPTGAFVPQGDIVVQYVGQAVNQTGVGIEPPHDPTSLAITTGLLATGTIGTAYAQEFGAAAGVGPYVWTIAGTLPPGIISADGKLSGTPTTSGAFNVQVTVRDAAGTQVTAPFTLAMNPAGLSIARTGPLPDGVIGENYATLLVATGGTTEVLRAGVIDKPVFPYTWSATGLPDGLTITHGGAINGTLTGASGPATIVVKVTDLAGLSAWNVFSLTLRDRLFYNGRAYAPRGDADGIWKPPPSGAIGPPDPLLPPTNEGDLAKIDHIVVVMMENRSFDHMLGYLSKEGGRSDVEGLKWENDSNRTQFNYYKGNYYYPERLTDTKAVNTEDLSPDHSHEAVKAQMADGMAHFVSDYAKKTQLGDSQAVMKLVMGYYGAEQLPTYDMLADQFAICDHWFCSHVGPTWPNRFVTLTGDLNRDSFGEPEVDTPQSSDFTPSEAATLFDHLHDRGVTWQYFQQRASIMRAFTKYTFDTTYVLEFDDPDKGFAASVKNGLTSVTFIDPLFGDLPAGINEPQQDNDDAPPSDLKDGQQFIDGIVRTLFTPSTNANWAKTMLIIVYDEHGGFYDHVQPPSDATPLLGQNSGKLGPRVPAFVVSAYTPARSVLKDTFDHATIAATILRRFCSPHPPVMSPRVSSATDLRGALSLPNPRGPFLLGPPNIATPTPRAAIRRFKAPKAADSFGSVLGGIALTIGAAP